MYMQGIRIFLEFDTLDDFVHWVGFRLDNVGKATVAEVLLIQLTRNASFAL